MSLFSLGADFLGFTDAIANTWYSIWLSLNSLVYSAITLIYEVFFTVASVNLFDEKIFESFTKRIYIVMGIAMLFIFAYNLILMIINPDDKKGTGQTTKVVKEVIISLVLIILLPTIFKYMNVFQNHVLKTNIIGNIILGESSFTSNQSNDTICDFSNIALLDEWIEKDKDENVSWWTNVRNDVIKYGTLGTSMGVAAGTATAGPTAGISLGVGTAGGFAAGVITGVISGSVTSIYQIFTNDANAIENLEKHCAVNYLMTDIEKAVNTIPSTVFSPFFHPTTVDYDSCYTYLENCNGKGKDCNDVSVGVDTEDEKVICSYYVYDTYLASYTGNISAFINDVEFYSRVMKNTELFEFNYILALLAGILALYMFVCYTLAIGVRVAKLGFLQIISPIAVMMRIIPKQKEAIFDKWFKELVNTYLDVFIRLMLIYFAIYACSLIPEINISIEGSGVVKALSGAVVVLGILKFAQETPELFKQFFGNSGNFALKSPKKQLSENKLAMSGVNAFRGGVYGATTGKGIGRLGGFFSGAGRGAVGGYDKAVKGIDTARTERANGSTMFGRALDRARVGIGMETRAESDDRNIEKVFNTTERKKQNEAVMSQIKNVKSHVEEKLERENSKVQFHVTDANGNIVEGNYDSMQKYLKSLQDSVSNATSDAERIKALKEMNTFRDNLGQQKKQAVENMVHALMNGSRVEVGKDADGNSIYAFNENDMSLVQTAVAEINKEIAKGGVGLQYDNDGNVIGNSERTKSITSGFDLLGDFKDGIEAQSYEIQRHSSSVGKNYSARHADSRMVRGNGQSEKK